MQDRNKHLNLFNFFAEKRSPLWEKNLVRNLALCLENEPVLFNIVLGDMLSECDFDVRAHMMKNPEFRVNVEQAASTIEESTYIFGVVLTPEKISLDESVDVAADRAGKRYPDLVIESGSYTVVIEAKTSESRRALPQLEEQINRITGETGKCDGYVAYSWKRIIDRLDDTLECLAAFDKRSLLVEDFANLLKTQHPEWISDSSLSQLSQKSGLNSTQREKQIQKRLESIKSFTTNKYGSQRTPDELPSNRRGIPLDDWDTALLADLCFERCGKQNEEFVVLTIWSADTKSQGKKFYKHHDSIDDIDVDMLRGKKDEYPVAMRPYVKFAHYPSGRLFDFVPTAATGDPSPTHNSEVFSLLAGQHKRCEWQELEDNLNDLLGVEWQSKVKAPWEEKVLQSDLSYVNVSFGLRIDARIPYHKASDMDPSKTEEKMPPLAEELAELLKRLRSIVEPGET